MPPAADLISYQIIDKFREKIAAIDPEATANTYWNNFDHVSVEEPPPEVFLPYAPERVKRLCFVWRDSDTQDESDTGRNIGLLVVIVSAFERYEFDDAHPFQDRGTQFLSQTLVHSRLESDIVTSLSDLHLDNLSRNAQLAETRPLRITTRAREEDLWTGVELMYEVQYNYQRAKPWLK